MNRMIRNLLGAAFIGALSFAAVAPSHAAEIIVNIAPPALRAEVIPPSPGVEFVWRPGYWRWNGAAHVWVGGEYIRRPHVGAVWVPGHWAPRGGGHVWIEGHWR